MERTRGQSAIEFIIIVGAILFFFTTFLFYIGIVISDETIQERYQTLNNIARDVQDELSLATKARDGYERTFFIPDNTLRAKYNISLVADSIYLKTFDGMHALSLPVANVTGTIHVGSNTIKKINGTVYLNQ